MRTINKMRCIAGLSICALVIVLTAVTLVMNIADVYNEETPEAGLGTLRMFTTISNVIAAVAAFAYLPFQIDGLRRNKYKLPEWIVTLMYVGAEGVFLTFFTALILISSTQGFVTTMLLKSNLFMHTINPIFPLYAIAFTIGVYVFCLLCFLAYRYSIALLLKKPLALLNERWLSKADAFLNRPYFDKAEEKEA